MTFMQTIPPEEASGEVAAMYRRQQAKFGYVPNYAKAFSLRPEIMPLWAALLAGIKRNMDLRQFELATLAAARTLGNSACSLAHGSALAVFFSPDDLVAILREDPEVPLGAADRALMTFAAKVAHNACEISSTDIEALRAQGFSDADIFDIAAAAAARAFFAKLLDGLGVQPDAPYQELNPALRELLTVGRPIDQSAVECLPA
ncbi:MAG: hypothetical protein R6W80_02380 [Haliea sp.]